MAVEHTPIRRLARAAAHALGALALSALSACTTPLFNPDDNRSQFDRYDAIRAEYAVPYTEDEFGRRTPNLRGRLSPKTE